MEKANEKLAVAKTHAQPLLERASEKFEEVKIAAKPVAELVS